MTEAPLKGTALLTCRGLRKSFGGNTVVSNIDFDVATGSLTAILGPSGCGKTTLLRLLAGFERQDAGSIVLDGVSLRDQPPEERRINTVFQSYALFPHMTVRENVAFPITLRSSLKDDTKKQVASLLAMVRLEDYADRLPAELSGGQQQRVAIARALAAEPHLLLLDEPLSALDRNMRQHVQLELKSLQKRLRLTFVLVTHDQDEALALADDIIVMSEGRIAQHAGPEEIYHRPANAFVADFIGGANIIKGDIRSVSAEKAVIETAFGAFEADAIQGLAAGDKAILVARPETLDVTPQGPICGTITDCVFQGTHWTCAIATGDQSLRIHSRQAPTQGAGISLSLKSGYGWIARP